MGGLSIVQAPSISLQSVTVSAPSINVSSAASQILSTQNAPSLLSSTATSNLSISSAVSSNISGIGTSIGSSLGSAASSAGIPTSVSGLASSVGAPTSLGGLASSVGISTSLPPVGQALNTLGLPNITAANLSGITGNITLPGLPNLQFPKLPEFPGIDKAGIMLGAGPAALAKQLKFDTMVPKFVPGLKINMGIALAAMSILKAAMSANPGALVKHLLDGVLDDLKNQALNATGVKDIQNQVNDVQNQVNGVVGDAKNSFISQYNQNNPPQTTTDENGNTVEIPAPPPDVSGFPDIKITPPSGTGILQSVSTNVQNTTSNALSQARAFTFPPNG